MKRVGVIGTGNMGGALLQRAAQIGKMKGWSFTAYDIEKERLQEVCQSCGATPAQSNRALVEACDTIVLAVKPQVYKDVMKEVAEELKDKTLISVMAGVSLSSLKETGGGSCRLARIMPNLPALIGQGALACAWGEGWSEEEKSEVLEMLSAMGTVVELPESLMDAVTGLSGSGPAYLFLFVEALSDAGVRAGIPRDTAYKLALQTVIGSAQFLKEKGLHPALAKEMVTSPGGTTIAGLHVMESYGLKGIIMDAVVAATERSRELGG